MAAAISAFDSRSSSLQKSIKKFICLLTSFTFSLLSFKMHFGPPIIPGEKSGDKIVQVAEAERDESQVRKPRRTCFQAGSISALDLSADSSVCKRVGCRDSWSHLDVFSDIYIFFKEFLSFLCHIPVVLNIPLPRIKASQRKKKFKY